MIRTNLFAEGYTSKSNLSRRILAGFIDYFIIYLLTFIYLFSFGEPDSEGTYTITGAPALVPVIIWGVLTVGVELTLGATLGNSLLDMRPLPASGYMRKLTFGESFKRHLLDPIDMFFFGLVGIVTIKNSDNNQRLGDMWAKTIVVNEKDTKKVN